MKVGCKSEDCGYYVNGECRLPQCPEREPLSVKDLMRIDGYLQEARQKYLKPYRERDCKRIEALCQKIEAIINNEA